LSAILEKDDLDPGMLSVAGEVYLQNGDAKRAQEYFSKALKLDPGNPGKGTALAIAHLANGQTGTAFEELESIAGSNSDTTADLALISAHLVRKEFDKALSAIDRLEAKQPERPLAANLRGRVQLAINDSAAARRSFERALKINPSYFAAAASLASLDLAEKKPDDAKKRFRTLLAQNPRNGPALLALAQIAAAGGADKDEVAGLLSRAVDANPEEVAPRLQLIELFLGSKDSERAMAMAQSAVAALPNSPELLEALGRAQQVSGQVNQAIATYSKLISTQPLSPQPHIRLAEAYMVNKNYLAAEQSLRRALDIKPDTLDAQRGLIFLAVQAKRYPNAIKIARSVQEQRPGSPVGFAMEGEIAAVQKNWDLALTAYRSALQRAGTTDLAIALNQALKASGKASESENFAANWQKDHPQDSAFRTYLGGAAVARNDYVTGERYYLSAVQAQPHDAIALNNLAWVTGQLHKNGAIEYAQRANSLVPNQPIFMDTLAVLLAEKREYAKAIDLQKKAVELQPTNAGLRLNLAKIYIKSGDKDRAKTELAALAKLGESFPSQPEVATLMKNL
jgi:putative PEP-CTERM system TPR-repeat lipoprotein